MNRVKLAEDTIKNVTDHVKDIRPDDLQTYYIAAYLPIMVDCLASIADSLEKIAGTGDLSSFVPIQPVYKEDVCRGRRLSDEESQAALAREQIEQQKVIRDMEKYLDREDKE